MSHLVIGTAGHIDHGKTSLVKALTGIDTDRLKEEKERGITIDIGFAYWKPGITIIDVPGHERFIRNMVAGVQSIDFVLFVIAADDGIMPQTVEHFEILRLLGIRSACVVITKCDLVSNDRLSQLDRELDSFFRGSPFETARKFRVSTTNGDGIPDLRSFLEDLTISTRELTKPFRMFIDRSFSVKGYGTVVTGTVLSGTIKAGEALELLPLRKRVRIRGLQQHTANADLLEAGDRAAINVAGIDRNQVSRGNILAAPDWLIPDESFFAEVFFLNTSKKVLRKSFRVRVLIGTQEIFGLVQSLTADSQPGSSAFCKLTFDSPVYYHHGDRFVLREKNATSTLGGGVILCAFRPTDATHDRHDRFLQLLRNDAVVDNITNYVLFFGIASTNNLAAVFGVSRDVVEDAIEHSSGLMKIGQDVVVDPGYWMDLEEKALHALQSFHREFPRATGMRTSELQQAVGIPDQAAMIFLRHVSSLPEVVNQNDLLALRTHRVRISEQDQSAAQSIEKLYESARFSPPLVDEVVFSTRLTKPSIQRLIRQLVDQGRLIRTDERLYFHCAAVADARRIVIDFIRHNGHIEVVQFKEKLKISRKFALSLLEYFDSVQLTEREDNHRILVSPK